VSTTWHQTTKRRPCPICSGLGCLITGDPDSPEAAICITVESARQVGAGWLHTLSNSGPAWPAWRRTLRKAAGMLQTRKETAR
jgi:hypothetical protein